MVNGAFGTICAPESLLWSIHWCQWGSGEWCHANGDIHYNCGANCATGCSQSPFRVSGSFGDPQRPIYPMEYGTTDDNDDP